MNQMKIAKKKEKKFSYNNYRRTITKKLYRINKTQVILSFAMVS